MGFTQRTCETNPITIIELKEKPECEKVEKVQLVTVSKMLNGKFGDTNFPQIRKCAKRCGSPRHHSGRTPTASEYHAVMGHFTYKTHVCLFKLGTTLKDKGYFIDPNKKMSHRVRELDHCEYVPNPLNTTLDYCQCEDEEIW